MIIVEEFNKVNSNKIYVSDSNDLSEVKNNQVLDIKNLKLSDDLLCKIMIDTDRVFMYKLFKNDDDVDKISISCDITKNDSSNIYYRCTSVSDKNTLLGPDGVWFDEYSQLSPIIEGKKYDPFELYINQGHMNSPSMTSTIVADDRLAILTKVFEQHNLDVKILQNENTCLTSVQRYIINDFKNIILIFEHVELDEYDPCTGSCYHKNTFMFIDVIIGLED